MKFQKDDSPKSFAEVLEFYEQFFPKPNGVKVGLEWERIGIWKNSKTPVGYTDDGGYRDILNFLVKNHGWEIRDEENGNPFTLARGRTLITTEGDGKPEISGDRFSTLLENETEIKKIVAEINEFSGEKIKWLAVGHWPFSPHEKIPLAPKTRYQTFFDLFSEYADWMRRYMKALCGAHINIGFESAAEMMAAAKALFRISPALCGALANSPMENGKPAGVLCVRRKHIFDDASPGRERNPPNFLDPDFDFAAWLDFYFDRDIIAIFRGKKMKTIPPKKIPFREFFEKGLFGETARFSDIDAHIKTCWVDMRPRPGYLEFRPLDSLELPELLAAAALVKAICRSEKIQNEIKNLTQKWDQKDFPKIHEIAIEKGFGEFAGISFAEILEKVLPLAAENLGDEKKYLTPLKKIVAARKTPAEVFLEKNGF